MTTSAKIFAAISLGAVAVIALETYQVSREKQDALQLRAQVVQLTQQSQTNLVLQKDVTKLREQNAAYAKTIEGMQSDLAKARAHASDALAGKAAATVEAAKTAAAAKAAVEGAANPMAQMFKDPETLKAMRPAQIATEKIMYGPLVKQLNLSLEQADRFYDILLDNGVKTIQAMQSGKGSGEAAIANTPSMVADLQALLGDAGYAQFQSYTQNEMPDRTRLATMKDDFADNPLSDGQQQQLLQAMISARQSVNAANPLTKAGDQTAAMEQYLQQQEKMDEGVLQQAAAFLSPAQLQTLANSQSNIINLQRSSAQMMEKMFGTQQAGK